MKLQASNVTRVTKIKKARNRHVKRNKYKHLLYILILLKRPTYTEQK